MALECEVQFAIEASSLPTQAEIQAWVAAAYQHNTSAADLTVVVRVVAATESAELNGLYRQKSGPTNVLSFPYEPTPGFPEADEHLGDLIVCVDVVQQEAAEQGKNLLAHWAHMVVHGMLHLQGYDHQTDEQAAEMENLETKLLLALNFSDPWKNEE